MSDTTLLIGKPNYSTASNKLVFHKLGMKEDERVKSYFIAPPLGSLAEKGIWHVFSKQHFGYHLVVGDKTIPVSFNCIEKKDRNKNIIQECPECNEIALKKSQLEAKQTALKAQGKSDEEIKNITRPLTDWLDWKSGHTLSMKQNLFAKSEQGAWGVLIISGTLLDSLKAKIAELRKAQIEPIGQTGIWFTLTRTVNDKNKVIDSAAPTEIRNGLSSTLKSYTLTEDDMQALAQLPALNSLGRNLSYEQIKQLVESAGEDSVVKAIFGAPERRGETSAVPTTKPAVRAEVANTTPQTVQSKPVVPVTKVLQDNSQTELQAKIAALQAQLSAAQKPSEPVTVQTAQPDMTADEFLSQYGE